MIVDIIMKNGDKKHYSECENIKYHTGFVEVVIAYYRSETFPSSDIKEIQQESRRSF